MPLDAKTSYDQTLPLHIYLKNIQFHSKENSLNSTIKRICYLVKMSFVYFFSIFLGKINALY